MDIDFDRLIELQNLDEEIKKTSLFLEKIPHQMKEIDRNIDEQFKKVETAKEKLGINQKMRRELEADVQDIKEQIRKFRHQQSGVKTNKEYTALLKEIEEAQNKIDAKEEKIISQMLVADEIGDEILTAAKKANLAKEKLSKEKEELEKKRKELQENYKQLSEQRESLLPEIPKDLAGLYQQLFAKKHGIVMSPVTDDFCSMCQIRIRPQVLNELKAESQIILCENCGRILYWVKKSA